jgi:DNA helicase HerA-like ATPase
MEQLGVIIEESTPLNFFFKAGKDCAIAMHEYVVVKVLEPTQKGVVHVQVLAEVVGLGSKNPLASERLASEEYVASYSYKILRAEILGYVSEEGLILRPKAAPDPNSPVYRADDETLQTFFRGIDQRIPLHIGSLLHRPKIKVPVHLQDMQFHLGIFAQTRAGKSYLSGKFMEEILLNTPFPVIVIDIHGDYVMMDKASTTSGKHGEFDVVVYYPPNTPRIEGVTAEVRELTISSNQMSNEAVAELLGTLGPRQAIVLRNILRELRAQRKPFGLRDIIARIEDRLGERDEDGNFVLKGQERERHESILTRLEDLEEEVSLPAEGLPVENLLRAKTLSVICLRGLRSRIQDAYTGILVDLVFRHLVSHAGDIRAAPPTFLFIEEAHRVAAREGGSRYAVKAISTAIREGAKFGLYLTLISQRPRSIDPDILSNIGNYAVLRITNQQDQSMIESASEGFTHRLVEDLPSLNQGEAVLVGPFVSLPAHVRTLDRLTIHYGATPNLKRIMDRMNKELSKRDEERW